MSKKEKTIEFINSCMRNPKTPTIQVGYIFNKNIINKVFHRNEMKGLMTFISSIYEEKDNELVNKVNGAKIIGIKQYDGIDYSIESIKQSEEKKEVEEKKKIEKPASKPDIEKKSYKRPESSLLNEFGNVSIETKNKGDK